MISANKALAWSYDYGEVARSVFIAIVASYAALDLAGRITNAGGRVRLAWLSGGALAMGIGIWAMHFKGMLAFHLPVPVEYHWPTVLASLLVAVLASAVALYLASRQKMGLVAALSGSMFMGAGIAGMHYIGMAAMRLPAVTRFSTLLVACSVVIAIVFSLIALLMAFGLREETKWSVPRRLGSAMVMGVAVSAMHYTGMAAASFILASPPDLSHAVSVPPVGNSGVVLVALIVLLVAITTSSVDRRRSEHHLRLVIDTAPAMLHSARPDGYVDFFNKRWLEYVGVPLEDIWGWQWTNVIHPEDVEDVVRKWRSAVATGKPFEAEARLRRANGEYRLMLLRKVPLRDEAGSIVKWYGSATDIEERKRAEQELREAGEHIRAILEHSPNWIFLKDTEGRYLLVNREIERVFGISQEQIKGKTDNEIFPPEPAAEYRANDLKVLRAGLTMEFEETALLGDGPHTSIVHKFPMFDTHGNIYAIGGVATDMTERKRAEEARRYSEEQYSTVVETATDAVVSINEDSKILFVNPATARIFGYDTSELIGQPLMMLMPESSGSQHKAGLRQYLITGQQHLNWQGTELTALRKNGQEFPVEVSFGEMTSNGHRVFTGFIRDISEKKRAEDELRKQKEVFQKIFDNIPVTIAFIGQDGHIELVNPEWERTTGWTLEEIRKQNPDLLAEFYPDPQYRQQIQDFIAASTGEWADRKARVRNGRVMDFATAVVHLSDGTSIAIGRDITERKRAEEALRHAREFDEAALKSLGEGLYTMDTNGLVTSMNPAAEELFGWSFGEMSGKKMHDMVHHHYRDGRPFPTSECVGFQALTHGQPMKNCEDVFIRKDGTFFDVIYSIAPMRDAAGQITGQVVVFSDITERKRAEEALRTSEHRQHKIARQLEAERARLIEAQAVAKVGSWEAELPGLEVSWSEQTHRIFETDPSHFEPSREDFVKFVHPEDRAKVEAAFQSSLDKRVPSNVEYRIVTAEGRVKVLEEQWRVFHNEQGLPVRLMGTCRDITERKLAEAELRESEARFRLVADSAPVMIWMSGADKLRTYFNKPWLDFAGRSIEQELGNGWVEGVDPADLQKCLDTYIHSFDRREAFRMEYRLRRNDGEYRRVLDIGVPRFNPDGFFAGYIGSCIDVTDQRRAEEHLHRAQEDLARVSRVVAMGELAAAIAHEVNQPLGAVVTNASASLRWLDGQPPNLGEAREAIDRTVRDANRASAVIVRIRALLQKGPPQMEQLNVNAVIQEVLTLAGNELVRGGVAVQTDLAPDVPDVLGDRVQLQQVLLNLILNGIDAMRTISHRARELRIKSAKHPDGALIQVHDSGEGVDPEQASRIFDPFFTTKPQGIGIGLSVGRSIVEAHGGRLWFTPGPSDGVVFQFTVPRADTSDERAA